MIITPMFVGMKYAGLASQESSFPDSEAKKKTLQCVIVSFTTACWKAMKMMGFSRFQCVFMGFQWGLVGLWIISQLETSRNSQLLRFLSKKLTEQSKHPPAQKSSITRRCFVFCKQKILPAMQTDKYTDIWRWMDRWIDRWILDR
jgi:hypothetical protein